MKFIDVTGVFLTPGDEGKNCLGNGHHRDKEGNLTECCCEECDFLMCCLKDACKKCSGKGCVKKSASFKLALKLQSLKNMFKN